MSGCVFRTSRQSDVVTEATVAGSASADTTEYVPLADPFILLYEGVYYAYGTWSENGIAVMESDNLATWRLAPGRAAEGLALHKDDVYGDKWFWAPEVYCFNGKFYMYFSADEHICVATSDSPLGPFVQAEKKPMIMGEKCIDNTLFVDDDDKKYMYFDRFNEGLNKSMNFDRFNDGLNIWVCELEDNLTDVKPGSMQECISVSQEWEDTWPRVNEGCYVIKSNGIYYMTYSAKGYENPDYGVGCATATSPLGPWIKYDDNPLLQSPGDLAGTGHNSMFYDKSGKLRIVFHAHNGNGKIYPRRMFIGDVKFRYRNGSYMMEIRKEDFLVPRMEKNDT